ncbi:unnamed protein product [Adineta ricciae]|uniref:RING-type domain-containing protein n=1 Tax=Adineta ricciae TaxID=249248 RepID=A0A815Q2A5_ADIRI|nr:unnamed protein product [Adineta ricciae]CAF1456139.1 unnamed protein product [Adineta ricciae]
MSSIIFPGILLVNYLLLKSHTYAQGISYINLHFYYKELFFDVKEFKTRGLLISKQHLENVYILSGNLWGKNTFNISKVTYKSSFNLMCDTCLGKSGRINILLSDILDNCIQIIGPQYDLLQYLQKFMNSTKTAIFQCTIEFIYDETPDKDRFHLSKTGLFGIIFLTTCIILTLLVCVGWLVISYYRRLAYRRMKTKLRKALAHSVQQALETSPVIIFDSKNNDNPNLDTETICAICLDTFSDNEKLRRLQCSHYYHVSCIDPWLIQHQSCPLCSQSVLDGLIPSVSEQVTTRENTQQRSRSSSDLEHQ